MYELWVLDRGSWKLYEAFHVEREAQRVRDHELSRATACGYTHIRYVEGR